MSFAFTFRFEGRICHAVATRKSRLDIEEYEILLGDPDLKVRFGSSTYWYNTNMPDHYGYSIPDDEDGIFFIRALTRGLVECIMSSRQLPSEEFQERESCGR